MPNYTVRVNGRSVQTGEVPAEMPLLWVLRDTLNMKGTKFGCGIGACGACTVHLNGNAVRSCSTRIDAVGVVTTGTAAATVPANRAVVTIEGLSADGSHALQKAWMEVDVPQCGYCQAGQIMSAAALLARTPRPNDEQIATAMNGNVCRCGTYLRIRQAINIAAGRR
jgi:isoquinoline 1-oxidoreductase alpha subunit